MRHQGRLCKRTITDGGAVDDILIWDGDSWEAGDISDLTEVIPAGTNAGQMLFWSVSFVLGNAWRHTEITEIKWDDTAKRLGINKAIPTSKLDVGGTVTMTRLLAGGVHE